jgi:hypothetical protein
MTDLLDRARAYASTRADDGAQLVGELMREVERLQKLYIFDEALTTPTVAALARAHGLRVAGEDEVVVPRDLFNAVKKWLDNPTNAPGHLTRINAWMPTKQYMDLCAMLAAAERQEQDDD